MDGWANGKCRGGFYFIIYLFFLADSDCRAMILHLHHPDVTMEDFIIVEGKRDLPSWLREGVGRSGVSRGDDSERNLHNNVLPLRHQFVPTSKDRPHCDHSLCKVEPNTHLLTEEPRT